MLYRVKTIKNTLPDGTLEILFTDELEPAPCARCGGESFAQSCPGDGRLHHHGFVHAREGNGRGGLIPACNVCIVEIWIEWNPHLTREQYRS